jgi:hypothetical protein
MLSTETRGWMPVRSETREFQLRVCTICNQNFKDGGFIALGERQESILYVSTNGHAEAIVTPMQCLRCGNVVVDKAGDFSCIEGQQKIWIAKDLQEVDRSYFEGSNFSVSREASSRALEIRCKENGCYGHERMISAALSLSHRYFLFSRSHLTLFNILKIS